MANKESKEFLERRELMRLQREADKEKHDWKMEELQYQRESEDRHHNHELERGRIKSAEIRKMQERKELMRMGR